MWFEGLASHEGEASDWAKLPDDGVTGVKVHFNDGLSRNCSGNDEYGLLLFPDGEWTIIHNNNTRADNVKRYPTALWKRGKWVSDAEMQAVNEAMSGN